jgi:hypothetical protein
VLLYTSSSRLSTRLLTNPLRVDRAMIRTSQMILRSHFGSKGLRRVVSSPNRTVTTSEVLFSMTIMLTPRNFVARQLDPPFQRREYAGICRERTPGFRD